jgi:hypothetical protein
MVEDWVRVVVGLCVSSSAGGRGVLGDQAAHVGGAVTVDCAVVRRVTTGASGRRGDCHLRRMVVVNGSAGDGDGRRQ